MDREYRQGVEMYFIAGTSFTTFYLIISATIFVIGMIAVVVLFGLGKLRYSNDSHTDDVVFISSTLRLMGYSLIWLPFVIYSAIRSARTN